MTVFQPFYEMKLKTFKFLNHFFGIIFQGQVGMIAEKIKKFGVHRYSSQSTVDDQYQGES